MNDFTKDELKQILFDMERTIFINGESNIDNRYIMLRDKVESMIENYCEHRNTVPNCDVVSNCDDCGENCL